MKSEIDENPNKENNNTEAGNGHMHTHLGDGQLKLLDSHGNGPHGVGGAGNLDGRNWNDLNKRETKWEKLKKNKYYIMLVQSRCCSYCLCLSCLQLLLSECKFLKQKRSFSNDQKNSQNGSFGNNNKRSLNNDSATGLLNLQQQSEAYQIGLNQNGLNSTTVSGHSANATGNGNAGNNAADQANHPQGQPSGIAGNNSGNPNPPITVPPIILNDAEPFSFSGQTNMDVVGMPMGMVDSNGRAHVMDMSGMAGASGDLSIIEEKGEGSGRNTGKGLRFGPDLLLPTSRTITYRFI